MAPVPTLLDAALDLAAAELAALSGTTVALGGDNQMAGPLRGALADRALTSGCVRFRTHPPGGGLIFSGSMISSTRVWSRPPYQGYGVPR